MTLFKELYAYRQMIFSLVKKDLRGRYKGSVLGFMWTFINPLLQLLVYDIVFTKIIPSDIDKYYIHLFVALIPWIFMSTSVLNGTKCIISQKDMVKKIYFPREVIPISCVMSNFVNMLLCFIVVFAVVLVSGIRLDPVALLFLPLVMLLELLLALGITMICSAVTVYFRDLEHIMTIIMMLWMYMSPVVYSASRIPEEYRTLYMTVNPLSPVIVAYRDILYYSKIPDMSTLIMAVIFSAVTLVLGFWIFGRLKRHFAEEL